jgi:hypothetical protein
MPDPITIVLTENIARALLNSEERQQINNGNQAAWLDSRTMLKIRETFPAMAKLVHINWKLFE